MSEFIVQVTEMITRIFSAERKAATQVLGDYERREARRSARWTFYVIALVFLTLYLLNRWIR